MADCEIVQFAKNCYYDIYGILCYIYYASSRGVSSSRVMLYIGTTFQLTPDYLIITMSLF